jgi:hypothetical protein
MARILGVAAAAALLVGTVSPAFAGGNGNHFDPFPASVANAVVKQAPGVTTEAGNGRGGENNKGFGDKA